MVSNLAISMLVIFFFCAPSIVVYNYNYRAKSVYELYLVLRYFYVIKLCYCPIGRSYDRLCAHTISLSTSLCSFLMYSRWFLSFIWILV